MLEPGSVCRLEPGTASAREQRKALSELGLIEAQTIPIFEEPLRLLPCWIPDLHLGFLDQNRFWFKSAVGLSQLGLMIN